MWLYRVQSRVMWLCGSGPGEMARAPGGSGTLKDLEGRVRPHFYGPVHRPVCKAVPSTYALHSPPGHLGASSPLRPGCGQLFLLPISTHTCPVAVLGTEGSGRGASCATLCSPRKYRALYVAMGQSWEPAIGSSHHHTPNTGRLPHPIPAFHNEGPKAENGEATCPKPPKTYVAEAECGC